MKLRLEIKSLAKENFNKQYWICVCAFVLIMACTSAISWFTSYPESRGSMDGSLRPSQTTGIVTSISFIATAATILLIPPLTVGYASFSMKIYRGETGDINGMFSNGFSNYWRKVGGIFWMRLFIFLWSLLFIIPGIIKAFSYSMTPYILADLTDVKAKDALKLSMKITAGHKGKIFAMCLSFIGWVLLTALTGGVLAIFYTGPYISASFAGQYVELKQKALESGAVTANELGI